MGTDDNGFNHGRRSVSSAYASYPTARGVLLIEGNVTNRLG